MWAHPQVYVDTGVIIYVLPMAEFYRYLQRLVEAGFGRRVMFGADQVRPAHCGIGTGRPSFIDWSAASARTSAARPSRPLESGSALPVATSRKWSSSAR